MRKLLIIIVFIFIHPFISMNTLANNANQKNNGDQSNQILVDEAINEAINEVNKKTKNLEEEQYKHAIWALKYQEKIYEYQHISSIVLLFVSLIVLICGLYFSYMQFKDRTDHIYPNKATKNLSENIDSNNIKKNDESKTSLKIGMAGIEISSSIIGLLILCVSLAFFYLYIANIYPVVDSTGNINKIPSYKLDNDSEATKNETKK